MSDSKRPIMIKAVALTEAAQYSLPNGNLITGEELLGMFSGGLAGRFPNCPIISYPPDYIPPSCRKYTDEMPPIIACTKMQGTTIPGNYGAIWGIAVKDLDVLLRHEIIDESQLSQYQIAELKEMRTK